MLRKLFAFIAFFAAIAVIKKIILYKSKLNKKESVSKII